MAARASTPTAAHIPQLAAEFERRIAGALPADFGETAVGAAGDACGQATDAVATRKASQTGARGLGAGDCPSCSAARADLTGSNLTDFPGCGAVRGGAGRRQPHQLRRARVRHGRDHERHRAARRLHPLRRHLPDLQRLQPQRHPHGRADEAARDPRLHARLDRPGRGRADAPAGRACRQPAPDPEPRRLAPRATRPRRRWRGSSASSGATAERAAAVAPEPAGRKRARRSSWSTIRARRLRAARPAAGATAVLLATGSEVALAMAAQQRLDAQGMPVRVVSMPSTQRVRPPAARLARDGAGRGLPRIGIEAGVTRWWGQYGCVGRARRRHASASRRRAPQVYEHFGLTAARLADLVVSSIETFEPSGS